MKTLCWMLWSCCLGMGLAGCTSLDGGRDIRFDRAGWGGPNLSYSHDAEGKLFTIRSGVLINETFNWNGSTISFEFLDKPDLVWGFVLTDRQFQSERRQALNDTWVKTASKEFKKGRDLDAEQLWLFDRVAEVQFLREPASQGYKVFDGWAHERIIVANNLAVKVKAAHDANIRRGTWNQLTLRIANGKLTYTLNGQPGAGGLQLDQRTNGRFGIFVTKDGPLLIRNLTLNAP
jgi:hypothetical protein